jgi:hypothetical protein
LLRDHRLSARLNDIGYCAGTDFALFDFGGCAGAFQSDKVNAYKCGRIVPPCLDPLDSTTPVLHRLTF